MTLDHRYQSKPEPTTMYPVEITLNEVRNIFISVWMKYVCESLWGHSLSVTYTQCNNMQARNTCLLFLIPFTWNKVNFPNNLKSWQNHQMQIHVHSFDQKSDAICLDQNYFQIWIYNTKPLLTINMSSWWVFFQYNFVRAEDGLPVSRETFMMILVDITAIHIRANYFSPTTEVRSVSQTPLVSLRAAWTEICNKKKSKSCPIWL